MPEVLRRAAAWGVDLSEVQAVLRQSASLRAQGRLSFCGRLTGPRGQGGLGVSG